MVHKYYQELRSNNLKCCASLKKIILKIFYPYLEYFHLLAAKVEDRKGFFSFSMCASVCPFWGCFGSRGGGMHGIFRCLSF